MINRKSHWPKQYDWNKKKPVLTWCGRWVSEDLTEWSWEYGEMCRSCVKNHNAAVARHFGLAEIYAPA